MKMALEIISVAAIIFVIFVPVFFIARAAFGSTKDFKQKARSLENGMTLDDAISIMGWPDMEDPPVYKWERYRLYRHSFSSNILYVSVVIQDDVIIAIDTNF